MTKLTIEQLADQLNNKNLDYALDATVITGSGVVCEDEEKELCNGKAIYEFMFSDEDFDGVFTVKNLTENIKIMNEMG